MSTNKTATTKTTVETKETKKPVGDSAMNPPIDTYSKDMLVEVSKRSKVIKAELKKVESSFSKIAFNLHWMHENEGFKPLGYKNIYDFANIEFGIARGTCNNFINVVERFGKRVNGEITEEIDDMYKNFKSSQLILMLGLSDDAIESALSPDMSVREMKKTVKELSSDDTAGEDSSTVEPSTQGTIDVESKEVNRQVLITVSTIEDYDSQEDKIYDMIRRALKDPKHKLEIAYTWE